MDESVSIAPVDTGTVLIPQNQGSAVEEPKPVMQIDPDPDFHEHEIVSHGPVPETSVESTPPETDVAEATPPSTGAEEDRIALSGPSEPEVKDREPLQVDLSAGAAAESPEHVGQFAPGPEIHASHTASDELNPETSGTPDRHTVDAIEAIPTGADAEEDNIAVPGTSETGVNLEHVALDSLVPEVLTTPDHKEDGLMAGSHGAETGVPAHFTADPELNTSHPPADEAIPIAPLNTDDRAHSDSDAEIPLHTDSNRPPPVAPLDAKILHTSAYEETSVQETEPSSNAPVPVDLGAVQSPDHGDILTRPVINVEAIEWSVPADPIQVDNDAPPLALGSSLSLAGSSAPEAPVRHVGFASPVATTLDVDDATEISGEAEPEEPKEEGAAVQQHVTVTTSAEAISPDLSQPSSAPPLMTDTVTSPEIVSVENLGTSEVKVETPRMSLTPTNSELALNDGFEPAKLDKPLTSGTSDTTGYPSPPISDIGLASAPASGPGVEAEDEIAQLHALPRELTIDTDTLVRSPNPARPTPGSPPSSRTHDTHRLQPRPPPRKNLTHGFVSLLYYFFPQIELASTIQTVPQSTGFFSIIGGFLIDMTFELTYLFWFFLSEVVFPRLHDLLRFTVLLVLSLFFSILGPFLGERGPSLHRKYTRPWIQGLQRSAPYYKERID
ncbi:hypothetical protein BS47DRAFT_1055700 [Hydnum rufescens UP504]|uniref:Uncharacterized protein n=1 Tax=Hydnum rufescens UP504 TaxID=1448309 RepID=A0A9P6AV37_9AGAM|nr:hypothetical protein BS47DRAFT_1055700 [Hydnum rufescens UP504]